MILTCLDAWNVLKSAVSKASNIEMGKPVTVVLVTAVHRQH